MSAEILNNVDAIDPPERRIIAPPITARELIPDVEHNGEFALDRAPILVTLTERQGSRSYTAVIDYQFIGSPFLQFLNHLAPGREMGINGVIADYALETDGQAFLTSERERLLQIHRQIPNWDYFSTMVPSFERSIQNASPEEFETRIKNSVFDLESLVRIIGESSLSDPYDREFNCDGQFKNRLVRRTAGIGVRRGERLRAAINRLRGLDSQRKEQLYNDTFSKTSPRDQKKLIDNFLRQNKGFQIEGSYIVAPRLRMTAAGDQRLHCKDLDDGRILYSQGEWQAVGVLAEDGRGVVIDESSIKRPVALKGALSWVKDDNKVRSIKYGDKILTSTEEVTDVLGPAIVSYLEPELRSKWPPKLGAPGTKVIQGISAVQVPLIAMLFGNVIASESKLIPAMEEWVEQHGVAA